MSFFSSLPTSVLQAGAIFLSIIIEALPFVLLGSIISGIIEVYITPEKVYRYLPKNKWLRIFFGTFVGFIFPSCECGIVPIINRFLEKKVPSYTAVPFLVTAPIINPIVLYATYSAFGNSWKFALLRALGAFIVALVLGIFLGFITSPNIQKMERKIAHEHDFTHLSVGKKVFQVFVQAIDEFFDMGRYLVFGSLFASLVQVYVPTRILTSISATPALAILLLMLLSFLLSLCSEADAFVGSSLLTSFGFAPVLAFLVIGPMLDVKNLMMMKSYFKTRFIGQFVGLVVLTVFLYSLLMGVVV
ncbi:permease [Streptococcus massiliensis]|uniref:Permease family protein n=1 Tax=Streptococcus massiliensis TaxID=313439 RepID=A0A380KWB9_9STRE|nr:permease [Streptococcus massiliensis]SUN76222.1 permease family protein [Streptococcus massiliensis]